MRDHRERDANFYYLQRKGTPLTLPVLRKNLSVILSVVVCSLFFVAMYFSDTFGRATGRHTVLGTTFLLGPGSCAVEDLTGGATAGRMLVIQNNCTLNVILGANLVAPKGWSCATSDRGRPEVYIEQLANDTTRVWLKIPTSVRIGDEISFVCAPN